METSTLPDLETGRISELRKYNILDTLTEKDYEDITHLASIICDAPIALISFVDEERQWFKSHRGIEMKEGARAHSFCAHAIHRPEEVMIVTDSREDERFQHNPYVTGEPNIVFYAGIPLVSENGFGLGTVCILDTKPRALSTDQLTALTMLSSQVMKLLEIRKTNVHLESVKAELETRNIELLNTAKRLELALQAGKLGTYILDIASGKMESSALCRQAFDVASDQKFDLPELFALLLPEDLDGMQQSLSQALENPDHNYDTEFRIRTAAGDVRWIHASGVAVYDEHGKAVTITGVTSDITAQKMFTAELEKQVTSRTKELGQKNADLENLIKNFNRLRTFPVMICRNPSVKFKVFQD